MAIFVKTKNLVFFGISISKLIKDRNIDTWADGGNNFYTHIPQQWYKRAWIKYYMLPNNEAIFGFHLCNGVPYDQELYAVYMGRFAEMLLAHFSNDIVDMQITPRPEDFSKIHIPCR